MLQLVKSKKKSVLLSVFCLLCIVAVSVQPRDVILLFIPDARYFSLAHAISFAGFSFFLCLFFYFDKKMGSYHRIHPGGLGLIFIGILGVSIGTELLQLFCPDRVSDLSDVIWDVGGGLAGMVLFFSFMTLHFFSQRNKRMKYSERISVEYYGSV